MKQFDPLVEEHSSSHTMVIPFFTEGVVDSKLDEKRFDANNLPIIASRDVVLFPGMTTPITVGRSKSLKVLDIAQKQHCYIGLFLQTNNDEEPTKKNLYATGCVAEVLKVLQMPDGTMSAILQGRHIAHLNELTKEMPYLVGDVTLIDEQQPHPKNKEYKALVGCIKDEIQQMASCQDNALPPEILFALANFPDFNFMTTFLCSTFPMTISERQMLLEENNILRRVKDLHEIISNQLQFTLLKDKINRSTNKELSELQRKNYLYSQMQTIKEELGEGQNEEIDKLLEQINAKNLPDSVMNIFLREVNKLQRMNEQAPDYSPQFNYLRTIADLPWGKVSKDNMSLQNARKVLDHDHYGLEKVKERILEHLAVLKLRGDMKAPILCLVGPPGVGKTSLGKSIARALKREYVRVSFGGLHDESEIRGHRKTYIGSLPGRIIGGLLKAGTDNPVFVLDEIDKIGADFKGDPASALLEVLDPEQNNTFHDNYLDIDYDLSKVLFIATANTLSTIAPPLRDRMEIIELSGYIMEEKVEIAERHLLPKQKEEHGLKDSKFSIPKKVMAEIVDQYTRESGVRLLDKSIAKIMRRIAWKTAMDETVPVKLASSDLEEFLGKPMFDPDKYEGNQYYGVVTGLAWTSVGGCILYVESSLSKGKGEKLTLTGNLGDVMKESAALAYQYIKSHAAELVILRDAKFGGM